MEQLTDKFGRIHTYLRISITDRCNLRCTYCIPSCGTHWKEHNEILRFEEIIKLAKIFINLGIKKIRITGGEPTIRKDLEKLIKGLATLDGLETLAMTTNGIMLKDNAKILKQAGLTALNISLDTLKRDRFIKITNRDNLNDVLIGIGSALGVGFKQLKLNVVVMKKTNDDEVLDFIHFIADKPINVRFIEFMPFKGNNWDPSYFISYLEVRNIIESKFELIPIKGKLSDVAKDFCIEGFTGTISFITSMTDSFCSTCNRLRLTADGLLKTCLFHTPEVSLRDALRGGATDAELALIIQDTIKLKEIGHEPVEELQKIENQSMVEIGG